MAVAGRVDLRPLGTDDAEQVAALVTGHAAATIVDGVRWVAELCRALDVPGLAGYGMTAADVPDLCAKARAASSMKTNPLPLTDGELAEIATAAL